MEAIEEALDDFRKVCRSKSTNYIEIELTPKENTDIPIEDEFCNYVLGLMKNRNKI